MINAWPSAIELHSTQTTLSEPRSRWLIIFAPSCLPPLLRPLEPRPRRGRPLGLGRWPEGDHHHGLIRPPPTGRSTVTWVLPTNGEPREDGKQCPHRWGSGLAIAIVPITNHPLSVPAPAPPSSHPAPPPGDIRSSTRRKRGTRSRSRRGWRRMAAYMGQWVGSLPTSLVSVKWDIKLLFIASYGRYGQLTSDN